MIISSILASHATKYVVALFLLLSAVSYIDYQGRADKEKEIKVENLETIVETRKSIDEAIINSPDTPDGAREWLLNRANRH